MCRATSSANGASAVGRIGSARKLRVWPVKSTQNVDNAPPPLARRRFCASAAMVLESTPPDSSAHSGTSEIIWRDTMSSSSARIVAIVVGRSSVCGRASSAQ
ncbi:Uncharacterised protein [Burkholderia pseudomallei]|nr:Uncharacterised protein [Burkholderia pseudomallei]